MEDLVYLSNELAEELKQEVIKKFGSRSLNGPENIALRYCLDSDNLLDILKKILLK